MSKSVNLILERRKTGLNRGRVRMIANRLAVTCVILVILTAGAAFFLEKDTTYDDLKGQQATLLTSLNVLKDKGVVLFTLKKRVASITTILKARKPYDTVLETLISSLPSTVRIDGYTVSEKNVSLILSSDSLTPLNTIADAFTAKVRNKDTFKKLTVDNFILDERSSRYSVSMTLQLL